jgi:FkbH-like protein
MTAEIKSFSSVYLDRIAQLTNKTNQFNLTTKRYTVGEIGAIALSDKHIKIYGKLADKYGENGLIAISVGRIVNKSCYIDLWLMSCRVLKRGMEFAMLDELVRKCKEQNVSEIIGYYYKSAKNSMVSVLYEKFGFSLIEEDNGDTIWKLDIKNYEIKNKFIEVEND